MMSNSDPVLCKVVACCSGMMALFTWNMILSTLPATRQYIWPGHTLAHLMGGVEYTGGILLAVALLALRVRIKPTLLLIAGALDLVVAASYCIVVWKLPLDEKAATLLLLVICFVAGMSSALSNSAGFGMAAVFPENVVGFVSAGNGAAGLYCFVVYLSLSSVAFDKSLEGQQALITAFAMTSLIILLTIEFLGLWILSRKPWFWDCLDGKYRYPDKEGSTQDDPDMRTALATDWQEEMTNETTTQQPLKKPGEKFKRGVMKLCWINCIGVFLVIGVTMLLVPAVGPTQWRLSYTEMTLTTGTFQTLNFLGRLITGWWLSKVGPYVVPQWVLTSLIWARLAFVPLFVWSISWDGWGWKYFLMVMLAISNSILITASCVYATTRGVKSMTERQFASTMCVIFMFFSCVAGLFGAHFLT